MTGSGLVGDYIPCKGCETHVGVMEYDIWPGVTVDLCGDCYDAASVSP